VLRQSVGQLQGGRRRRPGGGETGNIRSSAASAITLVSYRMAGAVVYMLSLSPPDRRNMLASAAAIISGLFPDLDSIGGSATARPYRQGHATHALGRVAS
jgi:hypothetical protein